MLTVLQAPATHLFPGLKGRVVPDGAGIPQSLCDDAVECVVEFSDGSVAYGFLEPEQEGLRWLALQAHTTSRGIGIPPKRWHLAVTSDSGNATRFRVASRGPKSGAR